MTICNGLHDAGFESLLALAYTNSFGTDGEKQKSIENLHDSLAELEKSKLNLGVKTLNYILKRSLNCIIKPEVMVTDLETITKMNKEKAEIVTKFYMSKTKSVLDGVEVGRELVGIECDLNVELSSSAEQRSRNALGVIRLETADAEKVKLELNHGELYDLYSNLEAIQDELDFLFERS